MHEWALAEALISAASEAAEKGKLTEVTEVNIVIGELQQIEPKVLRFALSQLKPTKFKNAKFRIATKPAKLKCRACQNEWIFTRKKLDLDVAEAIHFVPEVAHTFIKCPRCGSPDFEILQGRGIWLKNVKGSR